MDVFEIRGEYIMLNQLLKVLGWVESGAQANLVIEEGHIYVNGQQELRKRNKIYKGMLVKFQEAEVEMI